MLSLGPPTLSKVSKPRNQLMHWLDGVSFDGGITGSALLRSLFIQVPGRRELGWLRHLLSTLLTLSINNLGRSKGTLYTCTLLTGGEGWLR